MPYTTHTTLLVRLAEGSDQQAWREFDKRYGDLIRSTASRRGLQSADCDEVLQEVLLGLSKAMPGFQYDPAKGKFRSYLKTFVDRAIARRFRQNQTRARQSNMDEVPAEPPSGEAPDRVWEEEWQCYHLRLAMRSIEGEFGNLHRAAFESYVLDARSAAETARLLGLSVENVYQIKSRILKRLTELIEAQVQEEG
jgi:RNA polymerase sigma-70 factor (ECF subfamily)